MSFKVNGWIAIALLILAAGEAVEIINLHRYKVALFELMILIQQGARANDDTALKAHRDPDKDWGVIHLFPYGDNADVGCGFPDVICYTTI